MDFIHDQYGIKRKLSHINAVERLELLKKKSGSDPWPVIEECFKVWQATNPKQWQAYLVDVEEVRQSRRDKKFATANKDSVHDGILRYTLDIPEKVMMMIRMIYSPDELDMNKEFFTKFAKRFPQFKVAQSN